MCIPPQWKFIWSVPTGYSAYLGEEYGDIKRVIDVLQHPIHQRTICVDLKIVTNADIPSNPTFVYAGQQSS